MPNYQGQGSWADSVESSNYYSTGSACSPSWDKQELKSLEKSWLHPTSNHLDRGWLQKGYRNVRELGLWSAPCQAEGTV